MDFFKQTYPSMIETQTQFFPLANSIQEIPDFLAEFEHIVLVQIFNAARRAEMVSRS